MSYDITVHTRERTDTAGLVALVRTVRGLDPSRPRTRHRRRWSRVRPERRETAGDAAVRETSGLLFAAGTRPCFGPSFTGGGPVRPLGPAHSHSSTVELTRLDGVAELFTGMAEAAGCFYAQATVERGLQWTGRTFHYDGPRTPYLAGLGRWLGLPPEAPEWAWFAGPTPGWHASRPVSCCA